MPECAFCSHAGKLTHEHITSAWLSKLFTSPVTSRYITPDEIKEFSGDSIDYKVKAVCKSCNEGWMSDIEGGHAKPVLTPLITGELDIPITSSDARSIALFAFSKAVTIDYSVRGRTPFFPRSVRHSFRKHLRIPDFVNIYFCPFAGHRGGGRIKTLYSEGDLPSGESFQTYVCTCAFGHFVFQVLAVTRQPRRTPLRFRSGFREGVAVPLWPHIPTGYIWPHRFALMSVEEFDAFAFRWNAIQLE